MTVKPFKNSFLPLQAKVGGIFNVERRKAASGLITGQWEFHNNITDTGLDLMANAPQFAYGIGYYMNSCCVGTGNTAPSDSDTALASILAAVGGSDGTPNLTYVAGPPAYWQAVQSWTFGTGAAAGNVAEIGIYCNQSASPPYTKLFCRELVRDGDGNPTTIVVESDEILIVTYTLRFYLDTSDYSGSINIGGTDYSYTRRVFDIDNVPLIHRVLKQVNDGNAVGCSAYNGSMGSTTTTPTGSAATIYLSFPTYGTGTRNMTLTGTFGTGAANFSPGITVLTVYSCFHKYQFGFSTPIPKVTGQQMTVGINLSWDRYAP